MFFDLEMTLCEVFPSLSPFDIREKSVYEVLLLVRRLNEYSKLKDKNKKKQTRRPASDNWF